LGQEQNNAAGQWNSIKLANKEPRQQLEQSKQRLMKTVKTATFSYIKQNSSSSKTSTH